MLKLTTCVACLLAMATTGFADEATNVEIGKPAPDFTATGVDGKTFKLSDKLKNGDKNIALMFSRAQW